MRRREFITLLGGAAATWPLTARAQPGERMRRVGVLLPPLSRSDLANENVALFWQVLGELGWQEGRNLTTHLRAGVEHVKELVGLEPDVILAVTTSALIPLQRATNSIPIVFVAVSDPLGQGIVTSLARPTGNVTGFSNPDFSLVGKSLQMLKEIAPGVSRVALIVGADNGSAASYFRVFNEIAPAFGVTPMTAAVPDRSDIERTLEAFSRNPNGGLLYPRDNTTFTNRDLIVALAARHRLPAVYALRDIAVRGGLMSYGNEPSESYRGAAAYVDRILRGAKPSNLPVQQPSRFELVINLKTARALGLSVPLALQASADEVIE